MNATAQALPGDQLRTDTHLRRVSGHPSPDDSHCSDDNHRTPAVVGVDLTEAARRFEDYEPDPADAVSGAELALRRATRSIQSATNGRAQPSSPPSSGWMELRIWAESYEDAQKARIANTNRIERAGIETDLFVGFLANLERTELECGSQLRKTYKRVVPKPIVAWQKQTLGLGDHAVARLLGHLGHPVVAEPHHWEGTGAKRTLVADEPYLRSVGQLWQYCGHGAPGRAKKGATAEELFALGSPTLKMLVHLISESAIKQPKRSLASLLDGEQTPDDDGVWPYRQVYEDTRINVMFKTHTVECVRCGPSGKPAQPGSSWSEGHKHAHALRIVGKTFLRDLYIVASGSSNDPSTSTRPAGPEATVAGGHIGLDPQCASAPGDN